MRNVQVALAVSILALSLGSTRSALAKSTCWCEIATAWSDGTHNAVQVSLTNNIGRSYTTTGDLCWGDDQCSADTQNCCNLCNNASASYVHSQSFAESLCAKTLPSGTVLKAYCHVGTRGWQASNTIGTLTDVPAVSKTVCTCPVPSYNENGVVGGVTSQPDCAYAVCSPIKPFPGTALPTDNSMKTAWGFNWGNALYQFVKPTCVTTQVSPAQCGLK